MKNRAIRIVKHIGPVPCIAACTGCAQQFNAPMTALRKVSDATKSLQEQFDRHECGLNSTKRDAARITPESTQD